jgi:hypothetical protein
VSSGGACGQGVHALSCLGKGRAERVEGLSRPAASSGERRPCCGVTLRGLAVLALRQTTLAGADVYCAAHQLCQAWPSSASGFESDGCCCQVGFGALRPPALHRPTTTCTIKVGVLRRVLCGRLVVAVLVDERWLLAWRGGASCLRDQRRHIDWLCSLPCLQPSCHHAGVAAQCVRAPRVERFGRAEWVQGCV